MITLTDYCGDMACIKLAVTTNLGNKGFPEGRHYGVIAQEVEESMPEAVRTGPDGDKAVSYTEIIPVLIEAIKEQQKIIQKQQKEMEGLKAEIDEVKGSITGSGSSTLIMNSLSDDR
jgi:hypothetical protein